MITKEKGIVLGVFSADCLPIFIFDQKREIIGLLHAGWKGGLKGIAKEAIKILKKRRFKSKRYFSLYWTIYFWEML
jgi:copper oxidase (laccase) domain-containing protein